MTIVYLLVVLVVLRIAYMVRGHVLPEERRKTIRESIDSMLGAAIAALVITTFIIRPFWIPSGSMENTLQIHDVLLVTEWVYYFYTPAHGDIVVFRPVKEAGEDEKDYIIKRVIGTPGDVISIQNEVVSRNGQPIDEPYKQIDPNLPPLLTDMEPQTIKPGNLWVMGDNRRNSKDSRWWGQLPIANVVGRASVIVLPPGRMRHFDWSFALPH